MAVPPAPKSRLMLHEYLRPRFAAARGTPWRKHRREGGERSPSSSDGRSRGCSPISIPGDPREDRPTDRVYCWVPEPRDNTVFLAGGPRHPRLALCPHPLLPDGGRLAARLRLLQPAQTLPAPGAASDLARLSALLSGRRESAPLPRGPGLACPEPSPALRSTTDNPPLAPGPGNRDVSPRPPCTPRDSWGARLHSHIAHLPVHTIPHINNPSPPDTTSSPSALSSPFRSPKHGGTHKMLREGGSQQGLCGSPPDGFQAPLPRKLLGIE